MARAKVVKGRWVEVRGQPAVTMALLELGTRLIAEGRGDLNAISCGGGGSQSRWVGFVPESVWPDVARVLGAKED